MNMRGGGGGGYALPLGEGNGEGYVPFFYNSLFRQTWSTLVTAEPICWVTDIKEEMKSQLSPTSPHLLINKSLISCS